MNDEYKVPLKNEIVEMVNMMCNLSQKIRENGRAMGIIEMSLDFGVKKDYIVEMLQKKLDISSEEAQDYYDLYSKTQM